MQHLSGYAKDLTSQVAAHVKAKVKASLIEVEQKIVSKNSGNISDDERGVLRRVSDAALVEVIRTVTREKKEEDDSCDEEDKDKDGVLFGSLCVLKPIK